MKKHDKDDNSSSSIPNPPDSSPDIVSAEHLPLEKGEESVSGCTRTTTDDISGKFFYVIFRVEYDFLAKIPRL
jgi:hypothetical protein